MTLAGDTIAFLHTLCACSSPSGDVRGLRATAELIGNRLERYGFVWNIEEHRGDNGTLQPVVVAQGPAAGKRPLLLFGHLDTVLPATTPRLDDHRLVATGALDMKGGFAVFAGALEHLRETGRAWPDDLVLVAVPDEEVGGTIAVENVRTWGREARAVLVLEPGELRGNAETLVLGRRGLTGWRLEARGRAAHSGLAYWEGRSALAAAGSWCGRAQLLSESDRGPTVNVGRILGGDAELVGAIEEHFNLLGTNQRLNIVPDRCIAEGELRFLTAADRARTLDRMTELATSEGLRWEVDMKLEVFEDVAPVDPNGPGRVLAAQLVEAASAAGWTLELEDDRGGVSFPNFLPNPSEIPVLDGLGPVGGGMHTREEFLDLRSLKRRIPLLAGLLESLR